MARSRPHLTPGLLVLALFLLLTPVRAPAATVIGVLSNFDVHNFTPEEANDFHLILRGVTCADVANTYVPAGWTFSCQVLPNGAIHVRWTTTVHMVQPCTYVHFGLQFFNNPNHRVWAAWWTRNGRPLRPFLSFANQRWEGSAQCWVGDLVDGFPPLNRPQVTIDRDIAFPPTVIPLPQLTWDEVADLPWQPGPPAEVIPDDPEQTFPLPISLPGPQQAVIVRYPVYGSSPTQPDARLLNELVLNGTFVAQASLVNVDMVNTTEFCVNDLHLSYDGVSCQQFQQFYVPLGWAVECLDRPGGGGCDVRWYSLDGTCLPPGGILHVGWRLPGSPQYRVGASWWTWNGIPVPPFIDLPIQTWQGPQGPLVVDVVRGFPPALVPGPVMLQREFALTGPETIPLDLLTWPGTEWLPWQPADSEPQTLPPDPAVWLPFLFPPELTGQTDGLLIRYEVTDATGMVQMRFINEALIASIAPPPPVTDLQIALLDPIPGGLILRLSWTPSPVPSLYHVYRLADPYDTTSRQPMGATMDSFFDIFVELDLATRGCFMVTVEELPSAE